MVTSELTTLERIRAHIARYRITTVDAVHQVFYQENTREAAKKALNRFVAGGHVASFAIRKKVFYQLAGSPPVGSQTIWERYAVLVFCTLRPETRERMTAVEFEQRFPEFANQPGVSAAHQHYYLDHATPPRLCRILVDNDAETPRAVRKCHAVFRHAAQTPHLNSLLDSNLLHVTLLVAEQTKAQRAQHLIAKANLAQWISVESVPELNAIMPW